MRVFNILDLTGNFFHYNYYFKLCQYISVLYIFLGHILRNDTGAVPYAGNVLQ